MYKIFFIGLVVVMVALFAVGRFSGSAPVVSQENKQGADTQQSFSNSELNLAPDFTLPKLGGGTITLSEYRGKKPVVLDFWASWCPNCRRDMPKLNRFYEKYKDQFEVIGINLRENESTVRQFVNSRGLSFPIVFDPSNQTARAYGIQYTNTHFLIDKDGNLIRSVIGDIQEKDILSIIQ